MVYNRFFVSFNYQERQAKVFFSEYGSRSPLYLCPRSFASPEDATAIGAKSQQCDFLEKEKDSLFLKQTLLAAMIRLIKAEKLVFICGIRGLLF
ncbi:hypothetical protein BXU11_17370 [Flavobacterium sp. LM5]|nr:hypothetical protein BXU11_17370 [Flavobacterium sp. LM5]